MPVIIPTEKELKQTYRRVIAKLKAMSPDERFRTMVRAGIYTKNGQLTKKYGGLAERKQKTKGTKN